MNLQIQEFFRAFLEFKKIQGRYDVPEDHPTLGVWIEKHRKVAKRFANGEPSPYFKNLLRDLKSFGVEF